MAPAKPSLAVLETLGLIPLCPLHISGWMSMTFLLSVSVSRDLFSSLRLWFKVMHIESMYRRPKRYGSPRLEQGTVAISQLLATIMLSSEFKKKKRLENVICPT